jgi:serine phosphatase RsbU (regulator of sigma subunit)
MEKASFEKRSFAIAPGDRLVLYTDGVSGMSKSNLQTGRRERLGDLGVRDILKKNIRYPLDIFVKRSFSDIKAFNKGKPVDDALLLAVQIPE